VTPDERKKYDAAMKALAATSGPGLIPEQSRWDRFKQSMKEALTEDVPNTITGAVGSFNDATSMGAIPAIQERIPAWAGGVEPGTYSNAMAAAPWAAMLASTVAPNPLGKIGQVAKSAAKSVISEAKLAGKSLRKSKPATAVKSPIDYHKDRMGMLPGWEASDPNEYMQSRKWYHGTSTKSGMAPGDVVDPKFGNFSNAVHASPDPRIAKRFADQASALDGGKPVIYEIDRLPYARVERETAENSSRFKGGEIDPFQAPYLKSSKDSYGFILDDDGQPALAITDRGPFIVGKRTKDKFPTRAVGATSEVPTAKPLYNSWEEYKQAQRSVRESGTKPNKAVNDSIDEYLRRRDAERASLQQLKQEATPELIQKLKGKAGILE